tara:strand:- start:3201 stop:4352 length:1152 start_codon:yes stop_codon:yes gene_type:complete
MKKRICVISGGRMDYGHLFKVIEAINKSQTLELFLIATCMHLSPEFGNTYKNIINDGFKIDRKVECLLSSDTPIGISKSVGLATISFADAYSDLKPDIILVMGDRFELLAAVQAALFMRIPVAHISGGDTTEGAFDESIRHSITKMSHIHFVTNKSAYQRVLQLGEDPNKVFNVGSPTLDYIKANKYINKKELSTLLKFDLYEKNLLVTYHPVTLGLSSNEKEINEILSALDYFAAKQVGIIFTKSNADNGGHLINKCIDKFVSSYDNVKSYDALGQFLYYNVIKNIDCVIGNSSSGLFEVPSFKKPTVNIGDRQKGRERSSSVFDTSVDRNQIIKTINQALNFDCNNVINPYGDGYSSPRIIDILENIELCNDLLQKKFHKL